MIQKPGSRLILPALSGIAFLFLYFLLAHNNRLAADDFFFLKNAGSLGIWNGMVASYHSWVTRWMAVLFLNVILLSADFFHSLLPYHTVTIFALIIVVMNFIHVIAEKIPGIKISSAQLLLYSLLFISSFFFLSFDIGETWFWITSTAMYLWSILFLILGLTLIIRPGKSAFNKIVCLLCFLFIGGSSESTAVTVLIILAAGILFYYTRSNFSLKAFWDNARNRMLLIAFASIVVSLSISYSGEGRVLRASALPQTGISGAFLITVKSFAKLVLFQLPLKIHWFIFFSVPWIYLGYQFAPAKKEPLEKVFRQLAGFILIFLILSFISFIPVSFLLGETGPFRTWILVSAYLAACCSACGFYLGYKAEWNKKILSYAFNASLLTLIALAVFNIIEQKEITSRYAAAVDNRLENLAQLKSKGDLNNAVLDPLPSPGMLYSSEISTDSSHFSNAHVRDFLELKFSIRRK